MIIKKLLSFIIRVLRFLLRKASSLNTKILSQEEHKKQHAQGVVSSTSYDMMKSPGEDYYRDQYFFWIDETLKKINFTQPTKCLDLGCGQGRIAQALAQRFSQSFIDAVDISPSAIEKAKQYTKESSNIKFHLNSILDYLKNCQDESFDLVTMTEVTFFYPDWPQAVSQIKRVLKKGGMACISFRSQYYYLLQSITNGMWMDVDMVLSQRQGGLSGGSTQFTWQTADEIKKLFEKENMDLLTLVGIGSASGTTGDPLHSIAHPGHLDSEARKKLMQVEISIASSFPDSSRYMLAISQKKL